METFVHTGDQTWDSFCPVIAQFLERDKSHLTVNGRWTSGYRSPDTTHIRLRDHTHQMKGFRHFERDMISALDVFAEYQMEDGAVYDFFDCMDGHEDEDSGYVQRLFTDYANRVVFERCGVEADVEYLAVEAVHGAWQATGDDHWMASKLPFLERTMSYSLTSPERWSAEHQLVKRPFTIDTWDFEYGDHVQTASGPHHRREIDENTLWCIMHGDNSGMFHASNLLRRMYRHLGNMERASYWEDWARHIKQRTNEVCWNGRFYTHQVHVTPVNVIGVDETEQLSLSNTYDMNRGLPDRDQCANIIREYMRRREMHKDEHIAEWYGIDPSFPPGAFGPDYLQPGVYVNGGIMPLVGGELARAAFEHGFETYGADILRRYQDLAIKRGETYLWYQPDGEHVRGGTFVATDGWGSSAMLCAFIEGLCGVKDLSKVYETVGLAPRWPAVGVDSVEVSVGYAASGTGLCYIYECTPRRIEITMAGTGKHVNAHVLLPGTVTARGVKVDGRSVEWSVSRVEQSSYVDFEFPLAEDERIVEIALGR